MNKHLRNQLLRAVVIATAVTALPAGAEGDPAVLKDLTSVIAILGLPCGEVVSATRKAENDHVATCKDGNRYHVYLNAQGRVVADKQ